jgi:hypothetical protein
MMKNETLLTTGNPKIEKGAARGYLTSILHLAPSRLSGFNTCPMATAGCAAGCLNTAGRGGMFRKGETTNAIQTARIRKTLAFFNDRTAFMNKLVKEITAAIRKAEKNNLVPVFRLNGTSDIRWETVPVTRDGVEYANIMLAFSNVQFYDYTKIANRRDLPANYHLTFSLAESNDDDAVRALNNGMNVAAVFRTMPTTFTLRTKDGRHSVTTTVIDGDSTDLRFLDGDSETQSLGVIVGLKAKGRAKKDATGFVRN